MSHIAIPIPNLQGKQDIEVQVIINGLKQQLHYRVELFYWQDCSKKDWKVKGYTDGKTLAVLYVKNIGHVDVKKQDLFLDSFHFGQA